MIIALGRVGKLFASRFTKITGTGKKFSLLIMSPTKVESSIYESTVQKQTVFLSTLSRTIAVDGNIKDRIEANKQFISNSTKIVDLLQKNINHILNQEYLNRLKKVAMTDSPVNLNVFIVAAFYEEFGSATFLDLAYLIKHQMKDSPVILRLFGFFAISNSGLNKLDPKWQANSYTALCELNHFSKDTSDKNSRIFKGFSIDLKGTPFTSCFLFGENNMHGAKILLENQVTSLAHVVAALLDCNTLSSVYEPAKKVYLFDSRSIYPRNFSCLGMASLHYYPELIKNYFATRFGGVFVKTGLLAQLDGYPLEKLEIISKKSEWNIEEEEVEDYLSTDHNNQKRLELALSNDIFQNVKHDNMVLLVAKEIDRLNKKLKNVVNLTMEGNYRNLRDKFIKNMGEYSRKTVDSKYCGISEARLMLRAVLDSIDIIPMREELKSIRIGINNKNQTELPNKFGKLSKSISERPRVFPVFSKLFLLSLFLFTIFRSLINTGFLGNFVALSFLLIMTALPGIILFFHKYRQIRRYLDDLVKCLNDKYKMVIKKNMLDGKLKLYDFARNRINGEISYLYALERRGEEISAEFQKKFANFSFTDSGEDYVERSLVEKDRFDDLYKDPGDTRDLALRYLRRFRNLYDWLAINEIDIQKDVFSFCFRLFDYLDKYTVEDVIKEIYSEQEIQNILKRLYYIFSVPQLSLANEKLTGSPMDKDILIVSNIRSPFYTNLRKTITLEGDNKRAISRIRLAYNLPLFALRIIEKMRKGYEREIRKGNQLFVFDSMKFEPIGEADKFLILDTSDN